ncbi:MAG: PTS sugar transporter subunit IIB [Erysipelotrichaceae bacterium]|nr:PTS sugar transporter subunit IIB [Erysipelotrichaceae bacterium]MDY5251298.1 PTS sugar transporter subunit IIB [Erysipelotrichaceae bacterium]
MKILAVCSVGVGSSMILAMTIEKACKELGVDAEVSNSDSSGARGADCDVIFTSEELKGELEGTIHQPIYAIKRYMDLAEVKSALQEYLNEHHQ